MTLGWDKTSCIVDDVVARQIVGHFLEGGHDEVDTARMYSEGRTEGMLARAIEAQPEQLRQTVKVATKVNPSAESGDGVTMGGYRTPLLSQQFSRSLSALMTDQVDLFY